MSQPKVWFLTGAALVTSKLAGMQAELHQYQQLSAWVDGVR